MLNGIRRIGLSHRFTLSEISMCVCGGGVGVWMWVCETDRDKDIRERQNFCFPSFYGGNFVLYLTVIACEIIHLKYITKLFLILTAHNEFNPNGHLSSFCFSIKV